jgi:phosphate acetyltransferase
MELLEQMKKKAQSVRAKIVLPESKDDRILKAASRILQERITGIVLLGDPEEIRGRANALSIDLSKASITDPQKDPNAGKYIRTFYERRKHKGMTEAAARELLMTNYLYYGAMMVDAGEADGMTAGVSAPTADTVRAALFGVGLQERVHLMSSFFVIGLHNKKELGANGVFFMSDCGVVPDPDADQLADIALETAVSFRSLTSLEPRVALLSFSTKGSASDPSVEKIKQALRITREKNPGLIIDGELQADAALIPDVAERKDPNGILGGRANVLIFPNLEAGNIAYKLVEWVAGAEALGPVFQGLRKPINDLSRGSTVEDIVGTVIVTVLQI